MPDLDDVEDIRRVFDAPTSLAGVSWKNYAERLEGAVLRLERRNRHRTELAEKLSDRVFELQLENDRYRTTICHLAIAAVGEGVMESALDSHGEWLDSLGDDSGKS